MKRGGWVAYSLLTFIVHPYTEGMSKAGLIALIGFLSALLPFLGIPILAKTVLAAVFGVLVMALGFLVREERRWLLRALSGDHQTDAYTENGTKGYAAQISET